MVLSFSQKEDHIWISNWSRDDDCTNSAWPELCGASVVDFNQLPPVVYKGVGMTLDLIESNTSLCNQDGELILYSNGQSVHDTSHHWIEGGEKINDSPIWNNWTWQNEFGEIRSNGLTIVGGIGFIPIPDKEDEYWLLYPNLENFDQTDYGELWASKIEKKIDGTFKVSLKDSLVNDSIFRMGDITACKHANGRDWWMLQFNKDRVYTYLIDPKGIHLDHIQTLPFSLRQMCVGQSKFSSQGDQFALTGVVNFGVPEGNDFVYADFDRGTGDLLNPKYEKLEGARNLSPGLEFSPNGDLLYLSYSDRILQFDIATDNVLDNLIEVAKVDSLTCPNISNIVIRFGQLQLGADQKIYSAIAGTCHFMHRIERPNEKGIDCKVTERALTLPTFHFGTIPNFNTRRLGPLDGSEYDTLGIDNLPISRFWYEQDSTDYLSVQFWDVSYYRPEMWQWNFGDGESSTDRSPVHSYNEKGIYEVCLTVSNENDSHTSCQEINIGTSAINQQPKEYAISLFPNPVEEYTRLLIHDYLPENARMIIYDASGKKVHSVKVHGGENNIYLGGLGQGVYVYEILDVGVWVYGGKFVKT